MDINKLLEVSVSNPDHKTTVMALSKTLMEELNKTGQFTSLETLMSVMLDFYGNQVYQAFVHVLEEHPETDLEKMVESSFLFTQSGILDVFAKAAALAQVDARK